MVEIMVIHPTWGYSKQWIIYFLSKANPSVYSYQWVIIQSKVARLKTFRQGPSFLQNLCKSHRTTQFQKERWNLGIFTGKSKMQSWFESESKIKVIKSVELAQGGSVIHGATPYSYIKWCLTFSLDHKEITIVLLLLVTCLNNSKQSQEN